MIIYMKAIMGGIQINIVDLEGRLMNLTAFRAEGIKARSTGAETIYPPIRVGLSGEASSFDGWP
jgi:hypothetical protein